jgi:threonyl-tRNA synthetase
VRICPVNDSFTKDAEKLAKEMCGERIRADVDDRTESIGKKVRDAETEWVNHIVVMGEKERKSGKLAVRFRETGKVKEMKPGELAALIKKQTSGYPYRPLPMDMMLTKRPVFVG